MRHQNNVCLQSGMFMERDHLLKALTLRHYRHSGGTVTQPGQMAVRGGIVDVYPLDLKQPVRIEFFGDTIDSVREFNPHSQRSTRTLQQLILSLADEVDYQAQGATLFDYLPPHSAVFIDDPALFGEQFERQYAYHKHYVEEARKNNPLLPQLHLASYQQLLRAAPPGRGAGAVQQTDPPPAGTGRGGEGHPPDDGRDRVHPAPRQRAGATQIGRASCRERV